MSEATMLAVPANYKAVIGVVAFSFLIHNMYMPIKVMLARKKYGVQYPALYATKETCPNPKDIEAFNCVQRGHQNCLEGSPTVMTMMAVSGLVHPLTAAACGAAYLAGRLLYFQGYSTGRKNMRLLGLPLFAPAQFGLVAVCLQIFGVWLSGALGW